MLIHFALFLFFLRPGQESLSRPVCKVADSFLCSNLLLSLSAKSAVPLLHALRPATLFGYFLDCSLFIHTPYLLRHILSRFSYLDLGFLSSLKRFKTAALKALLANPRPVFLGIFISCFFNVCNPHFLACSCRVLSVERGVF